VRSQFRAEIFWIAVSAAFVHKPSLRFWSMASRKGLRLLLVPTSARPRQLSIRAPRSGDSRKGRTGSSAPSQSLGQGRRRLGILECAQDGDDAGVATGARFVEFPKELQERGGVLGRAPKSDRVRASSRTSLLASARGALRALETWARRASARPHVPGNKQYDED
jgi:hypothetical protein